MHAPAWLGDTSLIVVSLLVQGIPFLLIGSLLGAFISSQAPWATLLRAWPRQPVLSAMTGALLALFVPACDCAAVPVARRLIKKGVPLSAAISYLLAAPSLNPICLLSTYFAFHLASPWRMVALRAGGSFLIAVTVGLLVSLVSPSRLLRAQVLTGTREETESLLWTQVASPAGSVQRQPAAILAAGVADFLDVAALYVLGAIISALLQTLLPLGTIVAAHGVLHVPAAMTLAFLLSLCSAADAFVVNAFGALGLAGQLAFLWLGPIYNLRVLFLYRGILRGPAIAALGISIVLIIGCLTMFIVRMAAP